MHAVDRTVLDAIGVYEASCEAAGAPISEGAKTAAVQMALATHFAPEEVTARVMALVYGEAGAVPTALVEQEETEEQPKPRARARKGAK